MKWTESGGPPVKAAKHKGFGHVITIRALARVVAGEANIAFDKKGVIWKVDAPLDAIVPGSEASSEVA